jgi:hypothetical protein
MLPDARAEQLTRERLSSPTRYALLSQRMRAERHRPVVVRIAGRESLAFTTDSIAHEAAATSLQLHLRVPPKRFAAYYNAAQAVTGAQLAVGANSPYLLGAIASWSSAMKFTPRGTSARLTVRALPHSPRRAPDR